MHLNMCWPNLSHASKETKCISTCADQTPPMPAKKQNLSQYKFKINPFLANEDTNCISTYVDHIHPTKARTPNVSQLVFIKPISLQRGQKLYFNMSWSNPSHASEDTKCISTCIDKTPPMPARTQYLSQHVLAKPFPRQRGHNMHFNMCWPNASHVSEDTKWISTCVGQMPPMSARTQNAPEHVLTKPIPSQLGINIHLNMC